MSSSLSGPGSAPCSCGVSSEVVLLKKRAQQLAEENEELKRDKRSFRDSSDEARRTLARLREEVAYLRKRYDVEKEEKENALKHIKKLEAGSGGAESKPALSPSKIPSEASRVQEEHASAVYPSPIEPDHLDGQSRLMRSDETSRPCAQTPGKRKATDEEHSHPNKKANIVSSELGRLDGHVNSPTSQFNVSQIEIRRETPHAHSRASASVPQGSANTMSAARLSSKPTEASRSAVGRQADTPHPPPPTTSPAVSKATARSTITNSSLFASHDTSSTAKATSPHLNVSDPRLVQPPVFGSSSVVGATAYSSSESGSPFIKAVMPFGAYGAKDGLSLSSALASVEGSATSHPQNLVMRFGESSIGPPSATIPKTPPPPKVQSKKNRNKGAKRSNRSSNPNHPHNRRASGFINSGHVGPHGDVHGPPPYMYVQERPSGRGRPPPQDPRPHPSHTTPLAARMVSSNL